MVISLSIWTIIGRRDALRHHLRLYQIHSRQRPGWRHLLAGAHMIYNGVPKPEICDYPEYFEELGIEKGKYILGMCRFVPEKNLLH